jgi:hypothetical protein
MLKLSLDDLFGAELVSAFQARWASGPDAAAAQAERAIRSIIAPRDKRERFVAKFVLALIGPEPDGLTWMEALAKGDFKLRDNVTYAIGRGKESPSKFVRRQRDRISALLDHPAAKGHEQEYRNAYNDALRLVVASTLLMEMRKGVAAKAAIGAGWPLMAGVKEHLTQGEIRRLWTSRLEGRIGGACGSTYPTTSSKQKHPRRTIGIVPIFGPNRCLASLR